MTLLVYLLVFVLGAGTASAEPLATVGDRKIERSAVEKVMASELREIERKRYEILKKGIDGLINEALLELEAADRGISVEALVKREVFDKVLEPSQEEVQAMYEEHHLDLEGAPMEQSRGRIVNYLRHTKLTAVREAFFAGLRKKHTTVISLRPDSIAVETGPRVRGPATAPVTIIEFADYQCPYCKRAEASVRKILATYGDKIRFAFRDYPLEVHRQARPAAVAGYCADAQGKFWTFHDKAMASDHLSNRTLENVADKIGLDRKKFDTCIAGEEAAAAVDADVAAGEAAGVSGTPAFFINGRMLDGAQPFATFKKIIDEELAWKGRTG